MLYLKSVLNSSTLKVVKWIFLTAVKWILLNIPISDDNYLFLFNRRLYYNCIKSLPFYHITIWKLFQHSASESKEAFSFFFNTLKLNSHE